MKHQDLVAFGKHYPGVIKGLHNLIFPKGTKLWDAKFGDVKFWDAKFRDLMSGYL
jgi:hypothetical protein